MSYKFTEQCLANSGVAFHLSRNSVRGQFLVNKGVCPDLNSIKCRGHDGKIGDIEHR